MSARYRLLNALMNFASRTGLGRLYQRLGNILFK